MEKFYLSKTLLKMVGGRMHIAYPTSPPGRITKDGLKFKRDVLRHDCCREVKGMFFW